MRFNKATANQLMKELSKVESLIMQGRSFGIAIVVEPDTLAALNQSDLPKKVRILNNLIVNLTAKPVSETTASLPSAATSDQEQRTTLISQFNQFLIEKLDKRLTSLKNTASKK
jgi:hypothetical protein